VAVQSQGLFLANFPGMDALELLRTDHRKVNHLFEQYRTTEDRTQKYRLFERIRMELDAHANAEETVFYPAFRLYEDLKGLIEECYRDHAAVKALLAGLSESYEDPAEFDDKMDELIESVVDHADEEEQVVFPLVRKHMKASERDQLGRHIEAVKLSSTSRAA
jgi:hemerythrin superfamily protein